MAEPVRDRLFWTFASFWGIAAAYHFVGIFGKVNEDPPWRHTLFVGIDLLFAYGLLKRPRYFSSLFLLLMVQQYYTHGAKLLNKWEKQARVDWASLGVLVVLPIVLVFLKKDAKAQSAAARLPVRQDSERAGQ